MYNFLERVEAVKNGLSTSAFARELGMGQKTVDFYLRGERKPSVEFVMNICSKFNVSADWLLGLPERGGSGSHATANGSNSIAVAGSGAKVTVGAVGRHGAPTLPDCAKCKYRKFSEAFKAIQTPD